MKTLLAKTLNFLDNHSKFNIVKADENTCRLYYKSTACLECPLIISIELFLDEKNDLTGTLTVTEPKLRRDIPNATVARIEKILEKYNL